MKKIKTEPCAVSLVPLKARCSGDWRPLAAKLEELRQQNDFVFVLSATKARYLVN